MTGISRAGTTFSSSIGRPPLSHQDGDGEDVSPRVNVSSGPSTILEEIQVLESSINAKFAELQDLVQQHDRSMKQMLKAHQNSVKQSVKAQLEKLQTDLRRHIDDALQKQNVMPHTFTTRVEQELDPGQSEPNPSASR